jgi:hypothetical protein
MSSESDPEDTNPLEQGAGGGARNKTPKKQALKVAKAKREEATALTLREVLHQMGNITCTNQRLMEKLDSMSVSHDRLQSEVGKLKADVVLGAGSRPPAVLGLPSTVQDPPVVLSNGARVPNKTYLQAKSGDYVNLSEFSPNTEPSDIMESHMDDTTNQLVFRSKSVKKNIDCYCS